MSETIVIPLTKEQATIVDVQDADFMAYKWYFTSHGYACRSAGGKKFYLHRLILARVVGRELVGREECDHVNGNGLDNRRSNLRAATKAQNGHNRNPQSTNSSGIRGVWWSENQRRWITQIRFNGDHIHLGSFVSFAEAVAVRQAAELKYFGEYSPLVCRANASDLMETHPLNGEIQS